MSCRARCERESPFGKITARNPPGIEISSNRNTNKLAAAVVAIIRPSSDPRAGNTALANAAGRRDLADESDVGVAVLLVAAGVAAEPA